MQNETPHINKYQRIMTQPRAGATIPQIPTQQSTVMVTVPIEQWNEIQTNLQRISSDMEAIKSRQEKELLTVNQAGEMLHVSRGTIHGYVTSGKLPATRVGKKLYFKVTDIEAVLREGVL